MLLWGPGGSRAEGLWLLWLVTIWTQLSTAAHKKHLHLCGAPVPTVRVTNHKPTTRTAGHATSARSPPTCPISHSFQNKSTSNQTKDRALLQRHLVQYHSLKKKEPCFSECVCWSDSLASWVLCLLSGYPASR